MTGLNLPAGWLNDDFKKTSSYSPVLSEISQHYKTFSSVLEVRTVTAEYLVAMKLKAGRAYKNDISDIVGILAEHKANGKPLNYSDIDKAVIKLYGNWEGITEENKAFLESLFKNKNYVQIYQEVRENELSNKDILIDFEKKYENVTNMDNIDSILKALKEKQKNNK